MYTCRINMLKNMHRILPGYNWRRLSPETRASGRFVVGLSRFLSCLQGESKDMQAQLFARTVYCCDNDHKTDLHSHGSAPGQNSTVRMTDSFHRWSLSTEDVHLLHSNPESEKDNRPDKDALAIGTSSVENLNLLSQSVKVFTSPRVDVLSVLGLNDNHRDGGGRNEQKKDTGRSDFKKECTSPLMAMAAFSLFGLFKKKEEVNETVVRIHQARIAHDEYRVKDAEDLYHDALYRLIEERKNVKIEEKEFLEKRTVIINGLANLALLSGRVREAEELFKDCMKGLLMCGKEQTDNTLVEISLKLSNVYAHQKRFPEAMAGYKFCIKTQEKKILEKESEAVDADTLALYGLSLDNYARFLISRNEHKEAEKCLKQALVVSQQLNIMGEEIENVTLVILNNLATLFLLRDDFDSAQQNMEKAVHLAEKAQLPELAAYYCNLGSVYIYKDRFDEALELCQKSKKLAAKRKDSETESMADLCIQEIQTQKSKAK